MASTANASIGHLYVNLEQVRVDQAQKSGLPILAYYWVRESWRRTGVGTRLVDIAERWLVKSGLRSIAVAVDPSDSDAARLFLALNYYFLYETESYRDEFRPDGTSVRMPMTLAFYFKDY